MKKLIIFVILGLLLWMIAEARGHGLADWIMADPAMAWCCNKDDCLPAYQGEIERHDDGWFHVPTATLIAFDSERVYVNDHDQQVWRCIYAGVMRCLFLPAGA